ncbi:MAG: CHAT domain-containing protein, partial [Planctomycetales bacterium]
LAESLAFQAHGSVRLFHIDKADVSYTRGTVRPRVANDLYKSVLDDPPAIAWRHEPLEAFSQLLLPQAKAYENWFEAAMKRNDPLAALGVVDRMHRARFYSKLPLGGRLLNLRWIMQGPEAALSNSAMLQRRDLAGRFPRFMELDKQAKQLREQLKQQALLPEDSDQARAQGKLLNKLAKISAQADQELLKMVVRREPVEMVFPALREAKEVQEQLAPGQAVLVFYAASNEHHAFLLTQKKHGHWKIASPRNVKKRLTSLLKAMGNYDQGREVSASLLADNTNWHEEGIELLGEIQAGSGVDLGLEIDKLTIVPDGIYWYVPFEALPLDKGADPDTLLTRSQVRYAPTLGLTVADGRARAQSGDYAFVLGRLFPREDEEFSQRAFDTLRQVVPKAHAIRSQLLAPSSTLAVLLNGLVVLDDIKSNMQSPLSVAPFQIDRGRPGSSIQQWLALPWGSPDIIFLPGFHTPAENSLKNMSTETRAGNELFITSMGLFATGSRTVVLSRWRMGGQMSTNLIREFLQELPNTTAQESWQRAVEIAQETAVDPTLEPRVSAADNSAITGSHPFFWSGYLVIDWGPQGSEDAQQAEPPKLQFPKKKAG